jgi:hypothetical protein
MVDNIGIEMVDGRDAAAIVIFRDEGDHISTDIEGSKLSKLDLAKLCIQLGRALKAQSDEEAASA